MPKKFINHKWKFQIQLQFRSFGDFIELQFLVQLLVPVLHVRRTLNSLAKCEVVMFKTNVKSVLITRL
jgi:hypothetical protein